MSRIPKFGTKPTYHQTVDEVKEIPKFSSFPIRRMRRSKSTTDLRTMGGYAVEKPFIHTTRKPLINNTTSSLKNTAGTSGDTNAKPKTNLFSKPVLKTQASKPKLGVKRAGENAEPEVKNKVKKVAKVPDWDYKTRFGILNDKFNILVEDTKKKDKLISEAELISSKNESLAEEVSDLKSKVADLENQAVKDKSAIDRLHKENVDFQKNLDIFKSELETTKIALKQTQDSLEASQIRSKELEENYQKASGDLKGTKVKLQDALKQISDLQTKQSELETENDKIKLNVKNLNDEHKILLVNHRNACEENRFLHQTVANLKETVFNGDVLRRTLHNVIQDIRGNIRVFCRLRPPLTEAEKNTQCRFQFQTERTIEIARPNTNTAAVGMPKSNDLQEFTFDKTFDKDTRQEEVFEEISQLVQSALDGYHVCIFAYGQTGSGKTYTMQGESSPESLGMIPRSIRLIFETKETMEKKGWSYKIHASFLEIYNENIRDLLDMNSGKQLDIRYNDGKGTTVTNLTILPISTADELTRSMSEAQKNRSTAVTNFNEHSSRSHAVTKIYIEARYKERDAVLIGSVSLVDLAGSECAKSVSNERLTETKNINKSLSCLGNVMLSLHRKESHIPFRDSKLTYLLQSSLGGNCKCLMIANICPTETCYAETINALRFASKVKEVKTGSAKNRILNSTMS